MYTPVRTQTETSAIYLKLPVQTYVHSLKLNALKLLGVLPSEIKDSEVFAIEILLNTLYIQACMEGWSRDLREMILDGLTRTGELCDGIKRQPTGAGRTQRFFKVAKNLGHFLQVLVTYIIEVENTLVL